MTPLHKMQKLERENPYYFGNICPVCRTNLVNGLPMHGLLKCCWEHQDEAREMYRAVREVAK